jgi:SAM-dependent methyltransferase
MKDIFESVHSCRICKSSNLEEVLSLGEQPPANSLYKTGNKLPSHIPMRLLFCENCSTVQLGEDVDPQYLFGNYIWVTGTSKTAVKYSKKFSNKILSYFSDYDEKLFVVEVASNDGTFLKPFQEHGCNVLGIDPAINIAKIANENGVSTVADFFTANLASSLLNKYTKADIIFARNVIPHVKEIHSVISGIELLLSNDGVGVIEFHNAGLVLEENQYDYIYHEHLFYFTLKTIEKLLNMHNLNIFDVSFSPISGGAWVVYFSKKVRPKTSELIKAQTSKNEIKLNKKKSWIKFSENAKKHSTDLKNLILKQVEIYGKIVAYGASARSSTVLNYCGIDSEHISMIIDKNPLKHGLLTAGSNIPIVSYEEGLKFIKDTDIILLLAWNFKDEIIHELKSSGYLGQFIIPLPDDAYIT